MSAVQVYQSDPSATKGKRWSQGTRRVRGRANLTPLDGNLLIDATTNTAPESVSAGREPESESQVVKVPVERIIPAWDNPRSSVGDLAELVASIRAVGILQPLLVTAEQDGTYRIVCGGRRWAAAREADSDRPTRR
jgi:hypothetical protein